MAKTQDLKRRIRSVKNTRQLTKAMKMVSAAKLRRAQERITAARPYAEKQRDVLQSLASRAEGEAHPLLVQREVATTEIVAVSGDKGLCGAFNAQVLKEAHREYDAVAGGVELMAIGKKSRDYFDHRNVPMRREMSDIFKNVDYSVADDIGNDLISRYVDGKVDRIVLVYNEVVSAIAAKPVVHQLLPVVAEAQDDDGGFTEDYIYEPDAQALFEALLPYYVKNQIFQALLESEAGEHAMRMAAMDAATRNAGELIDKLTLTMNRVRQASITTEIIEVVSGAQALG